MMKNGNWFKRKRIKAGLNEQDIATALDLRLNEYKLIEQGEIKITDELLNKFTDVINNSKVQKLEKLTKQEEINKWFDEMLEPGYNGRHFKMYNLILDEYNYKTLSDFGKMLGMTGSNISRICTTKKEVDFNNKQKLYEFLHNDFNKAVPTLAKKKKTHKHTSNITNTMNAIVGLFEQVKDKNVEWEDVNFPILPEQPTQNTPRIERLIEEYNMKIKNINKEICELNQKLELYQEFINSLKGE